MTELSPQQTRERLERSYAADYKRMGLDASEVPRQVLADLELVDAVRAAGELGERTDGPLELPTDRVKHVEITDAEAETGTRLVRDSDERGEAVLFREFDENPLLTSEQWAKAGGRMTRILEGMVGASDYRVAVQSCAMPTLALEYAETYWYFMTRSRPPVVGKTDHNPFRFLSDRDAVRMLVAKVYAICDKSTGKMGPWYVK